MNFIELNGYFATRLCGGCPSTVFVQDEKIEYFTGISSAGFEKSYLKIFNRSDFLFVSQTVEEIYKKINGDPSKEKEKNVQQNLLEAISQMKKRMEQNKEFYNAVQEVKARTAAEEVKARAAAEEDKARAVAEDEDS